MVPVFSTAADGKTSETKEDGDKKRRGMEKATWRDKLT